MRFIHISDLHFGKNLDGLSLVGNGDQGYWVDRFLDKISEIKLDAVVIAGDIYDRGTPSAEATELLDRMLTALSDMSIPVLIIAGNHDSGVKLSFANKLLARKEIGIHIAGKVNRQLTCVSLEDEFGPVNFWLMPYTFPAAVQNCFPEEEGINSYETAVKRLLEEQDMDCNARNVLVAHQTVTANGEAPKKGGSETAVGGVDAIDYRIFDAFDYVALGHIHASYPVGRDEVRYAGSPLCYHFDEAQRMKDKGPILVTIGRKNEPIGIERIVIEPLHPLKVIDKTWDEITTFLAGDNGTGEYVKVNVTDKPTTAEEFRYLKTVLEERGSRLMEFVSSYRSEFRSLSDLNYREARDKTVEEYFSDLYTDRKDENGPDGKEAELFDFIGKLVRDGVSIGNEDATKEDALAIIDYIAGQEKEVQDEAN